LPIKKEMVGDYFFPLDLSKDELLGFIWLDLLSAAALCASLPGLDCWEWWSMLALLAELFGFRALDLWSFGEGPFLPIKTPNFDALNTT
jgi:hypothetical protein